MAHISSVLPLLLLLCPLSSAYSGRTSSCSATQIYKGYPANIHDCIAATARAQKAIAVAMSTGVCVQCELRPTIKAQTPEHCPRNDCAAYRRWYHLEPEKNRSFLLFRSHANSGLHVLDAFLSAEANDTILDVEQLKEHEGWYKSPLFASGIHMFLEAFVLELLDSSGKVVVKLDFKPQGDFETGGWLKKSDLLLAMPWQRDTIRFGNVSFLFVGKSNWFNGFVMIKERLGICNFNGYFVFGTHVECQIGLPIFKYSPSVGDIKNGINVSALQLHGLMPRDVGFQVYRLDSMG